MSLTKLIPALFLIFIGSNLFGQDPVEFSINCQDAEQGETLCFDVTVENFDSVASVQFVVKFDPTILQVQCPVTVSTSALNQLFGFDIIDSGANFNCTQNGLVSIVWTFPDGVTLNDGDVMFTLCFDVIGDPGMITPIEFGSFELTAVEVSQYVDGQDFIQEPVFNGCDFQVLATELTLVERHCGTAFGTSDGSITFYGISGTPPYNYTVTPGGFVGGGIAENEEVVISGLGSGTYTITLNDDAGNTATETVNVVGSGDYPFDIVIDSLNPSCFDRNNGKVVIEEVIGGVPPYSYAWSNNEFFKDSINRVLPGTYAVTVTDFNGCTSSEEVTLVTDTLFVSLDNFSSPSCVGGTDGFIQATASGGTPFPGPEFNFMIEGVDGTAYSATTFSPLSVFLLNNLPEGTFELTASDDSWIPCTSDPIVFTLVGGSFDDVMIESQNIDCFGDGLGSITLVETDPTSNYTYEVILNNNGPVPFVQSGSVINIDNLAAADYTITIEDTNAGCMFDTIITITEPEELVLSVLDSLGPGCGGGGGTISFEVNGGTEQYEFLWPHDGVTDSDRDDLTGGTYTLEVTDANGCTDEITFTFADGGSVGLNAFVCQALTCRDETDANICAEVGVAGTFTFNWEDASGTSLGSGTEITGVGPGLYFVTATDGNCVANDTVLVANPDPFTITYTPESPSCPTSNNGRITANVLGGTPDYMYEWIYLSTGEVVGNGRTVQGFVGEYSVKVTDMRGCMTTDTFELLGPPEIIIAVDNFVSTSCHNSCDGEVTISASGGTTAGTSFTYFISGAATPISGGASITYDMLCAGENWVFAVDGLCESDTVFFDAASPAFLEVDTVATIITDPLCFGEQTGEIQVQATGGNPGAYTYNWVNESVAGSVLSGLGEGFYTVEITDADGCTQEQTITLENPELLVAGLNPLLTFDNGCNDTESGRITLEVMGGTGDYSFDWTPNVSNENTAINLPAGDYTIVVSDENNCTAEINRTVQRAEPVVAVLSVPEPPACFGGTTCIEVLSVSGGTGSNYTFQVQNGLAFPIDTCITIPAGETDISVFDELGCAYQETIFVDQPAQVLVDAGPDLAIDLGETTDPIALGIVSELDIDSIVWNPASSINCETLDCQTVTATPPASTTYRVTVIDENGCSAFDDLFIDVNTKRNVFAPNIFTPGLDSENGYFQLITGNGVVEVTYLHVFDRWGNKMYTARNYVPNDVSDRGWDGTYKGTTVDPGVYVYVAEVVFVDGFVERYRGDVTVVR